MLMLQTLKSLFKFGICMFLLTIVCTLIWGQLVDGRLYNCTDSLPWGFLSPGDWVHNFTGHMIRTLPEVVPDGDMSHPDTIKAGWSVERLWLLWFSVFGVSVVISAGLARLNWFSALFGPPAPTRPEVTHPPQS